MIKKQDLQATIEKQQLQMESDALLIAQQQDHIAQLESQIRSLRQSEALTQHFETIARSEKAIHDLHESLDQKNKIIGCLRTDLHALLKEFENFSARMV